MNTDVKISVLFSSAFEMCFPSQACWVFLKRIHIYEVIEWANYEGHVACIGPANPANLLHFHLPFSNIVKSLIYQN